jgi:hypothetical protein
MARSAERQTACQTVAQHRHDAVVRDWPADLVEIHSPQLSRLRHLDEQLRAQEISELRETGSAARTSSGVYVP